YGRDDRKAYRGQCRCICAVLCGVTTVFVFLPNALGRNCHAMVGVSPTLKRTGLPPVDDYYLCVYARRILAYPGEYDYPLFLGTFFPDLLLTQPPVKLLLSRGHRRGF